MQSRKNRTRKIRKEVCFTPEEYEHVKLIMDSMGIKNFQYYALNQLRYGQLVRINFSELKHLRVAINRIGVNINQIAKQANENQTISPEQLAETLDLLTDIKQLVATKLSSSEKKALAKRQEKIVRQDITEW